MVEIVGHSQTKGRDNREPKLRPKPGAPVLDPTDERDVETESRLNH